MLGIMLLRCLALAGAILRASNSMGLRMIRWRCPLCDVELVAVSCEAMLTVIYYHLLSEHAELVGVEQKRGGIL
jgi:uncharacterized protein with PIN domain